MMRGNGSSPSLVSDRTASDISCRFDGDFQPVGYGYQWWIPRNAQDGFTAIGTKGQFLHIFPEQEVVIVQHGDASEYSRARRCRNLRAHRIIADSFSN